MNTLGIILARKGSKQIKKKNHLKINNKSLVEIAIDNAKKSKHLNDIIFSSDDDTLISLAKKKNILVPFKRPRELSGDNAKSYDVIKHSVNWYENNIRKVDLIVILQPTTPFRKAQHIDKCIKKIKKNPKANSVITITKIDYPCEWSLKKNANYVSFNNPKGNKIFRRQDAINLYKPSGLVYVIKKNFFYNLNTILPSKKCLFVETSAYESVNIDSLIQFKFALFLYSQNKKK